MGFWSSIKIVILAIVFAIALLFVVIIAWVVLDKNVEVFPHVSEADLISWLSPVQDYVYHLIPATFEPRNNLLMPAVMAVIVFSIPMIPLAYKLVKARRNPWRRKSKFERKIKRTIRSGVVTSILGALVTLYVTGWNVEIYENSGFLALESSLVWSFPSPIPQDEIELNELGSALSNFAGGGFIDVSTATFKMSFNQYSIFFLHDNRFFYSPVVAWIGLIVAIFFLFKNWFFPFFIPMGYH